MKHVTEPAELALSLYTRILRIPGWSLNRDTEYQRSSSVPSGKFRKTASITLRQFPSTTSIVVSSDARESSHSERSEISHKQITDTRESQ